MRRNIPTLIIAATVPLWLATVPCLEAQTLTTLHAFTTFPDLSYADTNSDGAYPIGEMVLSGNRLFGVARGGGVYGDGTLFAVNTDGTSFTNLFNFSNASDLSGDLTLGGNTLYGVSGQGGTYGDGMIFRIDTDGSNFAVLYNFDGESPEGGLVLSGSTLYGVAHGYSNSGLGDTVFSITTNGNDFTTVYTFNGYYIPTGRLLLSGGMLYGATTGGGSYGYGTIFVVGTNGDNFEVLHSFTSLSKTNAYVGDPNSDGASPNGGLILSGNTIYGTAQWGGQNGSGTVFSINTNGSGFTVLHSLAPGDASLDGAIPAAGLTLWGKTLYGTASWGDGSIFAVNTDGTGFTNLHYFSALVESIGPQDYEYYTNSDGADPICQLVFHRDTLYGTASEGGSGEGTVFSFTLVPNSVLTNYPDIIRQTPTNSDVYAVRGTTETLSVTATGPSLQYQWFNGSGPIASATNSSLVLSNIDSSMDGNNYWVVVSNSVGSVSNAETTLHVVFALRQLPAGYWSGVGYWPNVPMTYTIEVGPPTGTIDYAVQEQLTNYPVNNQTNGLTGPMIIGPISDGGTFDANNYIIKWGPFFDDSPRTLTYVLTAPPGTTNWAIFSGVISIDGTNFPVLGDNAINLLPLHPADNGGNNAQAIDGFISIDEMASYASSWRAGSLWPVEPNPIPINYMTSAGFIWAEGGYYAYEPSLGNPPNCWVSTNPPPGSVQPLPTANPTNSASTVVSSMPTVFTNNVPFTVTLTVTPTNNTMAYAVEDQIPGGWTVTNISSSGVYSSFDSYNNEVKWGPIFAPTPTRLTYEVIPPTNAAGSASFAGVASFDGADIPITGVRQISTGVVTQPSIASINFSGANLTINGTNQSPGAYSLMTSTNLFLPFSEWIPLTTNVLNTSGDFSITATNAVDSKTPQRFFILQVH